MCEECSKYEKKGIVKRICVDCGCEFEVDSRNRKKIRCDCCQKKERSKYMAQLMKERRKAKITS